MAALNPAAENTPEWARKRVRAPMAGLKPPPRAARQARQANEAAGCGEGQAREVETEQDRPLVGSIRSATAARGPALT